MMEKTKALDFCELWLPAWSGNQPETLIKFYDENIYYQDPARSQGIRGRENLLIYFHKLLAKYPDWIWRPVEIYPSEIGFILKWCARVSVNSTKEFFGLDILEMNKNLIIRNEVFFDPALLHNKIVSSRA